MLLFDPRLFAGGDNVVYYLLAEALATGRGYVTLYEPGEPPHTLYPPGYPLVLVPVMWLGGSWWLAKAVSFLAAAATLAIAARYLWRRLDPASAPAGVLAFALLATASCSTFLAYSHLALSEMAYLAVSFGALAFAEGPGRGARAWLPAALLAGGGILIRTAALPLCAAVPFQVWRTHGRRAGAAAAAIALAPLAAWALRNRLVAPDAPSYLSYFLQVDSYRPDLGTLTLGTLAGRVGYNLATYLFLELPRTLWPFLPGLGAPVPAAGYVVGLVLAPLALVGLLRQVRARGVRAGEVYVLLSAGVLAAWQWQGDRFLLPLVPLLLAYVGTGAVTLGRWVASGPAAATGRGARPGRERGAKAAASRREPARRRRQGGREGGAGRAAWTLAALAVLPNVAHALLQVPAQLSVTTQHLRGERLAGYDPTVADFFAASTWLGSNAAPDAVAISRKPQFTYLFSRRKSVLYPYGPPERIEAAVREVGADYLIYDRLGASADVYLRPYLLARLEDWTLEHEVGDPPTVVFERAAP